MGLASLYMHLLPRIKAFVKARESIAERIALLLVPSTAALLAIRASHRRVLVRQLASPAPVARWRDSASRAFAAGTGATPLEAARLVLSPIDEPMLGYMGHGVGVFFGLAVGEAFMKDIPLPLPTSWRQTAARLLVGMPGLGGIFLGIRAVEKLLETRLGFKSLLVQLVRLSRFGSVPISILIWMPRLFLRLGI